VVKEPAGEYLEEMGKGQGFTDHMLSKTNTCKNPSVGNWRLHSSRSWCPWRRSGRGCRQTEGRKGVLCIVVSMHPQWNALRLEMG